MHGSSVSPAERTNRARPALPGHANKNNKNINSENENNISTVITMAMSMAMAMESSRQHAGATKPL